MKKILEKNYILIIFCFFFLALLIKGIFLIYPDLNIFYPFLAPDSYDWIANGLHYAGYDVNFTFRPPGLPLIIAGLYKLKALGLLPVLNQLVLFGILLVLFKTTARQFGKAVSIILTIILFFNFFLQNLSLFILADTFALLFLLLGLYFYIEAENDEKKYFLTSIFWSVSFLFQYAVIFIIPGILIHFFIFRKKIRPMTFSRIALPAFLFVGTWMIYKKIKFGSFLYSGVKQIELLNLHFDSIFFYLLNIVSVLGVMTFALLLFGAIRSTHAKNPKQRNLFFLNFALALSWFVFWVLLYDWNDKRFVAYLLPFLVPFIAVSIKFLLNFFHESNFFGKTAVVVLLLICVAWSAVPYESLFSFDKLKLTNSLTLEFKTIIDQKTFKGSIDAFSFRFVRDENGFSPINLFHLASVRKTDFSELDGLNDVQKRINSEKLDFLCIKADNLDGSKIYILSNRYGNFFKKKVTFYPDCLVPDLQLSGDKLQSI